MVQVTPTQVQPLEQAIDFRLDVAGAEANVATHLVRAGRHAMWAGAVGNDPLGRRVLATLGDRGVDTTLVHVDEAAPTGVYFKDPQPDGTRVWYYRQHSAASRLGPEFAASLPLADADLVHVSGINAALSESNRALLDEVIALSIRAGVPVSFDVNFRPALWSPEVAGPVLYGFAQRCDYVFVGLDEAAVLWGTSDADSLRDLVAGPGQLVVKDGAVGASAFAGGRRWFIAAPAVKVVEPVGAGDAFAGGYLASVLAGESPEAALERGHEFAAVSLTTTADL